MRMAGVVANGQVHPILLQHEGLRVLGVVDYKSPCPTYSMMTTTVAFVGRWDFNSQIRRRSHEQDLDLTMSKSTLVVVYYNLTIRSKAR